MTPPVMPVAFDPIYKPKPWGGRAFERLFGKTLPTGDPVGESWELADLPGNESRVARGPLAGKTLGELIRLWGADLLGAAALHAGRFPLLIKFLDAREALSVQVHPRPRSHDEGGARPELKNEAWYVLDAEPGARMHIGLKPGVEHADIVAALASDTLEDLLTARAAEVGNCFYLPSGVPHALGAGAVVAEVQTPSDVTYRLYDWGRVGLDGRPRELHIEQALANIRYDVAETEIVGPRETRPEREQERESLVACDNFVIERARCRPNSVATAAAGEMRVWILLSGKIAFEKGGETREFVAGEVVLLPAAWPPGRIETATGCEYLEVGVPGPTGSSAGARTGRTL